MWKKTLILSLILCLNLSYTKVFAENGESKITLSVKNGVLRLGEETDLTGNIEPLHNNVNVFLLVWDGSQWQESETLKTDENSQFSFKVKPTEDTFYAASWAGDQDHNGSFSGALLTMISESNSSVSLEIDKDKIQSGESIELKGDISPPHPGAEAFLERWNGQEWEIVEDKPTSDQSSFSFTTTPPSSSFYTIVWAGDEDHDWAFSGFKFITVDGNQGGNGDGNSGGGNDNVGNTGSTVTLSSNAQTFKRGETVNLTGKISFPIADSEIILDRWDGLQWIDFLKAKTDAQGNFSFSFPADSSASFSATWGGDENHEWAYSEPLDIIVASEIADSGKVPWSGWWWPYWASLGPTMYDQGGPLDKYDQFILATTGINPNSRGWEAQNHSTTDPNATWWGHCHAWAAAAILEPEPASDKNVGGITFTVSDQKGLLSEAYDEPQAQMWGDRFGDGIGSEDYNDIYPLEFEKVIEKYLKDDKRALIFDLDPGDAIWNFPAYKYATDKTTDSSGREIYTTTIWFTNFSNVGDNAHYDYTKTYKYWISGSQSGWLDESQNDHPDFLWLPTGRSPQANTGLSYEKVKEITQ